jgi:hypothetical protein
MRTGRIPSVAGIQASGPNWKTRSSKRLDPLDSNALCNNCGYSLNKHDGREGIEMQQQEI